MLVKTGLEWWDRFDPETRRKFESLVFGTGENTASETARGDKVTKQKVLLLVPAGDRENPKPPVEVTREANIDHLTPFKGEDKRSWEHYNRSGELVLEEVAVLGVEKETGLVIADCTYKECRHRKNEAGGCYRLKQKHLVNPKLGSIRLPASGRDPRPVRRDAGQDSDRRSAAPQADPPANVATQDDLAEMRLGLGPVKRVLRALAMGGKPDINDLKHLE